MLANSSCLPANSQFKDWELDFFAYNNHIGHNKLMDFEKKIGSKDFQLSLQRNAFSLARNKHDGEDSFQETFRRILEKKDSFQEGDDPLPWALTIMRNLFLDSKKKKREFQQDDEKSVELEDDHNQEQQLIEDELIEDANKKLFFCVKSLSNDERSLFTYKNDGSTHERISKELKLSLANVRVKMHRLMEKLMSCMRSK